MTLRQQQSLFARLLAELILWAYDQGYEITGGEWWRTLAQARLNVKAGTGTLNSLHRDRLAVDLNLFRGGRYLSSTESHRPLGEHWKAMHPLCRWGGDFSDGNHYSMTRGGRA